MSSISMTASLISTFTVNSFFAQNTLGKIASGTTLSFFNKDLHKKDLPNHLRVRPHLDSQTRDIITNVIIKYWGCFCKEGDLQSILDYEFRIDTRTYKPFCCRKPQYGLNNSKIFMSQIEALIHNSWIEECGGLWGSSIVLVSMPHQEHITNIDNLYSVCAYPIVSLTIPPIVLNFQYSIVMLHKAALVRALIQFLSSVSTPTKVAIKFKCAKPINKS